jgi:hypothetical protein
MENETQIMNEPYYKKYSSSKLKYLILKILEEEKIDTPENIAIYKLFYGLISKNPLNTKELSEIYNVSVGQIKEIINDINSEIISRCTSSYRNERFDIYNHLHEHLSHIRQLLLTLNIKESDNAKLKQLLEKDLGNENIIGLKLINNLSENQNPTLQKLEETPQTSDEHQDTIDIRHGIISCVDKFQGQYGRSGIAKLLQGSRSIKSNMHNNDAIKSEFFGMFRNQTQVFILSEIDKLLEEKVLLTRKITFGRPVLVVNPKIEVTPIKKEIQTSIESTQDDDEDFKRILHLINEKKNVFITGHAGTGKSYILNKLKERIKDLVITSTTGIAAVNVKGQTLHSWAGVGICKAPIEATVDKIIKRRNIRTPILECKILAVDEVSMLDVKTFEYVDEVLREVRDVDEPFGGIQVIFIGDFFQLPPVTKEDEEDKTYAFESPLWNEFDFKTVLLTKNHRQKDEKLITALSHMRVNALTYSDVGLLKTRECWDNDDVSDILHIFSTNSEADYYNNMKFNQIESREYRLYAKDGIYKGKSFIETPSNERDENILKRIDAVCSADKCISLKIGARVMLLFNQDFEHGLINGSCGVVKDIDDDEVVVAFDNGYTASVESHSFEFYNNEVLIGARKQFPLRLAYGITIHKSQGMSLDKLVVDCSRIFERGQAYVALSRIKTLEGLYLHNFTPSKVMVDEKVVDFYNSLDC